LKALYVPGPVKIEARARPSLEAPITFLRDDPNQEIHMSSAFWLAAGTATLLLAACRPSAPSDRADRSNRGEPRSAQEHMTTPQEEPDTVPPADVSHGEAPIGGPQADPAPVVAQLAPAGRTRLHQIRLEIHHTPVTIAQDVRYAAWTFGGTVPGPALHVRQGDTVDFTLVNRANIPHSMDFHAAEIAPNKYYVNVLPGDSLHYRFVARVPGAFMYHCGTAPAAMHIANGMYGALIVDPVVPRPKAREFVFVQSEFYLTPKPAVDGTRGLDWERLLSLAPDHVVFNGRAGQYAAHPIGVTPNQLLRLYVINAGPNRISSFHVVGGIFERVFQDGSQASPLAGVQTVNVPVGGGSIFELRLREPGDYPFVTHAFADATKGAVGVLRALAPGADSSTGRASMAH
jgi:copper-containing nitrite reductase